MSTPAQDLTVVADGKNLLTASVKGKAKWNSLLAGFLWSVQDLEDVVYSVIQSRNWLVNPPTNDVLTRLASLVGLQRNGQTDPVLWTQVLVQLRVLRSNGLAEDVLQVANLITPSSYTDGQFGKTFLVESYNIVPTTTFSIPAFVNVLGETKDGGSRAVLHYSTWDPALNLTPSSRYGGAVGTVLTSRYATVAGAGVCVAAAEIVGT